MARAAKQLRFDRGEVEHALDAAQHRVVDLAAVAQLEEPLSLHADEFELSLSIELGSARRGGTAVAAELAPPRLQAFAMHVENFCGIDSVALQLIDALQRSLRRLSERQALFFGVGAVVLNAKFPNDPRKRPALTDEGCEQ